VHAYHEVLYVVAGSMTRDLPPLLRRVTLGRRSPSGGGGDRLALPAHMAHAAVGPEGVVCLEGQR
jgi:hypothetical protein